MLKGVINKYIYTLEDLKWDKNYLNISFYNNIMYNHIILSSSLFGSIFLFSTSLILTNKALLEDKKIPNEVFVLNGLTMLVSGSIIVYYNFSLLNLSHFKSSLV